MRRASAFLVFAFCAISTMAADPPQITFESRAISVRVTQSANTAWFSLTQQIDTRGMTLTPRAFTLLDDNADGIVRVTLQNDLPGSSFWAVVDLTSGLYTIASPASGGVVSRLPLPAGALQTDANGKSRVHFDHRHMFVFVARHGTGATAGVWYAKIADGTANDADAKIDGRVAAAVHKLGRLGQSPIPPDVLQGGDIIIFAEPSTLTVFDGTVPQ